MIRMIKNFSDGQSQLFIQQIFSALAPQIQLKSLDFPKVQFSNQIWNKIIDLKFKGKLDKILYNINTKHLLQKYNKKNKNCKKSKANEIIKKERKIEILNNQIEIDKLYLEQQSIPVCQLYIYGEVFDEFKKLQEPMRLKNKSDFDFIRQEYSKPKIINKIKINESNYLQPKNFDRKDENIQKTKRQRQEIEFLPMDETELQLSVMELLYGQGKEEEYPTLQLLFNLPYYYIQEECQLINIKKNNVQSNFQLKNLLEKQPETQEIQKNVIKYHRQIDIIEFENEDIFELNRGNIDKYSIRAQKTINQTLVNYNMKIANNVQIIKNEYQTPEGTNFKITKYVPKEAKNPLDYSYKKPEKNQYQKNQQQKNRQDQQKLNLQNQQKKVLQQNKILQNQQNILNNKPYRQILPYLEIEKPLKSQIQSFMNKSQIIKKLPIEKPPFFLSAKMAKLLDIQPNNFSVQNKLICDAEFPDKGIFYIEFSKITQNYVVNFLQNILQTRNKYSSMYLYIFIDQQPFQNHKNYEFFHKIYQISLMIPIKIEIFYDFSEIQYKFPNPPIIEYNQSDIFDLFSQCPQMNLFNLIDLWAKYSSLSHFFLEYKYDSQLTQAQKVTYISQEFFLILTANPLIQIHIFYLPFDQHFINYNYFFYIYNIN